MITQEMNNSLGFLTIKLTKKNFMQEFKKWLNVRKNNPNLCFGKNHDIFIHYLRSSFGKRYVSYINKLNDFKLKNLLSPRLQLFFKYYLDDNRFTIKTIINKYNDYEIVLLAEHTFYYVDESLFLKIYDELINSKIQLKMTIEYHPRPRIAKRLDYIKKYIIYFYETSSHSYPYLKKIKIDKSNQIM